MHKLLFESISINLELQNESIICGTIHSSSSHDTGSNEIFFDYLKHGFLTGRPWPTGGPQEHLEVGHRAI